MEIQTDNIYIILLSNVRANVNYDLDDAGSV